MVKQSLIKSIANAGSKSRVTMSEYQNKFDHWTMAAQTNLTITPNSKIVLIAYYAQ